MNYVKMLNDSIRSFFFSALKIGLKNPVWFFSFLTIACSQSRAVRKRLKAEKQGSHIPPVMIVSVTDRCNLKCRGCYSRILARPGKEEISADLLKRIFNEAHELGISIILLAGGEPFMRPGLLDLITDYPKIVFPVFTNGLLIDDKMAEIFYKHRNIIPVISMEGYEKNTDIRRGRGIFNTLMKKFIFLKEKNILFGVSLTATRKNFKVIMTEKYIEEFMARGCHLFFYIEYIPVEKNTQDLVLTKEQAEFAQRKIADLQKKYPALFISFPGGEKEYGGCLAAGRGFIHISARGNIEPCPFSPFSDTSLKNVSLEKALESGLLKTIRENPEVLAEAPAENSGGCALWEKREWVSSLVKEKK